MKWPLMNAAEVHQFGMEAILDHIQKKEAVIVEAVNDEVGRDPQIVGKRWGKPAFIFVHTALYPDKGALTDQDFMRLLAWATKHSATAFFAGVGLACRNYPDKSEITDETCWSLPIKNGGFAVAYEGLLVMTTSDKVRVVR
nr:C347 [uncultured bacterium]